MSPEIDVFSDKVVRYCVWAESNKHDLETARELLLALMRGIPYLIAPQGKDDQATYPERSHEDYKKDHKRFSIFHSSIIEKSFPHAISMMKVKAK